MQNFVVLQLRYVHEFQDLATAIFCSQLHYWYSPKKNGKSKLQILREGHLWVAKSLPEWSKECGLSEKQIRRSIDVLLKSGVIIKESYVFGGQPTTHIRLVKELKNDILPKGTYITEGLLGGCPQVTPCPTGHPHLPSGAPPLPSGAPPLKISEKTGEEQEQQPLTKYELEQGVVGEQNSKLCATYITTENTTEITCNELQPQKQEQQPKPLSGKVTIMKGKVLNSASEILSNLKKKNGTVSEKKQTKTQKMVELWREVVPKYNEQVKFVATFTIKQKAQLGQFATKCGDHHLSVMRYVLMNWISYSKFVKNQQGLKVIPESPTLGFLLKYAQEAVNFYMAECTTEKVEPMQLAAPKPLPKIHSVVKEKPASIEDILAMAPKK